MARREALELHSSYGGNQAGLLQALVCGYRGGIERSGEYEAYKIVGLAHVIAVSGSHLALIALVVNLSAQVLRVPVRARTAIVAALIVLYFVFSGCTISALRAVVMAAVSLMSTYAARRASSQNALAVCLLGFILWDVKSAVSVSLALSAGSTLGLILFTQLVQHWFGDVDKICRSLVVEPLSLTLSSGVATQLYSAALFSQLSLVSPLANLLAAPLFTIGCVMGLLATIASLVLGTCAPLLISVSSVLVTPLQLSCEYLSLVPWASVPVELSEEAALLMTMAASMALYRIWPGRTFLKRLAPLLTLVVFLCLLGRCVYVGNQDELIMLDVGQGDALVLRSRGSAVLVDTGNRSGLLREALGRNWVMRLDLAIISHADDDHCGSLVDLSRMLQVSGVAVSSQAPVCGCEQCVDLLSDVEDMRGSPGLTLLDPGDVVAVGNFSLKVVWPYEYADSGGNGDSVCLLVEHVPSGALTLLTGDAESDELAEIIRREGVSDLSVLKLGHHGSKNSVDEKLLEAVSPKVSLISVGEGNRYGHPDTQVVSLLDKAGSFVLRTDQNGDICIRYEEDALLVSPQRRGLPTTGFAVG